MIARRKTKPSFPFQPDRIHVSDSFAEALSPYPYLLEVRGEMQIKVSIICLIEHEHGYESIV